MSDNHFLGGAEMAAEAGLSDGAAALLRLLLESAAPGGNLGEASLERWLELAEVPPKSAWRRSFEAAEELKAKGFVRGYYGKARRGSVIATFTDALMEAGPTARFDP